MNEKVICGVRAARCICHKDPGHELLDDPVHECDQTRCTGAWKETPSDPFQIVRLPLPVGTPKPWPDGLEPVAPPDGPTP